MIAPDSEDPYNALGETVNVASRIQKLVSGGEIVIGAATKQQVDGCFELEELGPQDLRGVSAPVDDVPGRRRARSGARPSRSVRSSDATSSSRCSSARWTTSSTGAA